MIPIMEIAPGFQLFSGPGVVTITLREEDSARHSEAVRTRGGLCKVR